MDAVFQPKCIYIDEESWNDSQKRDQFLERLLDLLQYIDEVDDIKILWNDELEEELWNAPQMPPWRSNKDWSNQLVSVIYNYMKKNSKSIEDSLDYSPCKITPELSGDEKFSMLCVPFLKIMHYQLKIEQNVYIILEQDDLNTYSFFCECHSKEMTPIHVLETKDLINYDKILEYNWPKNGQDIPLLEDIIKKFNLEKKYDLTSRCFRFEQSFIRDIISINELKKRRHIVEQLLKGMMCKSCNENNNSLNIEPVQTKENEYRMRVNDSERIHFISEGNEMRFIRYYSSSQHDDGLK